MPCFLATSVTSALLANPDNRTNGCKAEEYQARKGTEMIAAINFQPLGDPGDE